MYIHPTTVAMELNGQLTQLELLILECKVCYHHRGDHVSYCHCYLATWVYLRPQAQSCWPASHSLTRHTMTPNPNLRLTHPRPSQDPSMSLPGRLSPYFWPNKASSLSRSTCGMRCSYHMAARSGAQTRAPWPGTGSFSCDTSEINGFDA